MEDPIKIVRMNNGDDIISRVSEENGILILKDPMIFAVANVDKTPTLLMENWLPKQLSADNTVMMNISGILGFIAPNKEFEEYYTKFLEASKRPAEELSEEEMATQEQELAMEEIKAGQILH